MLRYRYGDMLHLTGIIFVVFQGGHCKLCFCAGLRREGHGGQDRTGRDCFLVGIAKGEAARFLVEAVQQCFAGSFRQGQLRGVILQGDEPVGGLLVRRDGQGAGLPVALGLVSHMQELRRQPQGLPGLLHHAGLHRIQAPHRGFLGFCRFRSCRTDVLRQGVLAVQQGLPGHIFLGAGDRFRPHGRCNRYGESTFALGGVVPLGQRQAGRVVALAEVAQQVDTIDVLRRVIAQTVEVVAGAVIVGEVQHAIFIGNHGAAMEATLLREYQLHLAQFCIHIVIADLLTVIPNGPQITGVVHGIQQITVDTFLVDSLSHRGNGHQIGAAGVCSRGQTPSGAKAVTDRRTRFIHIRACHPHNLGSLHCTKQL